MFWCLPPSGKCEWANLKEFARQFNEQYGSEYRLSRCLDVSDNSRPQPEVLLEAPGEIPMVIERKAVVWPPDYFKYHRTEHEFRDLFLHQISGQFDGDLYALRVQADSLRGNKQQVQEWAMIIAREVLQNRTVILTGGHLRRSSPFPWSFGRYPEFLRDESTPEAGVGVDIVGPLSDDFDVANYQAQIDGAMRQLNKVLSTTTGKFAGYSGSLKIVVLEFYGDFLSEETAKELVAQAEVPAVVDQVWVARPDWVSPFDWQIAYDRVR